LLEITLNQFIDNDEYKSLPITKDLVAVGYSGFSELYETAVQGLVLIYKDFGKAYAIEQVLE
jgi:hypothetical protein